MSVTKCSNAKARSYYLVVITSSHLSL
uniref:Uncharacterized protein n=1 Tax=Anguilla anguilla TaxID=7936 RepID=A0A0E9QQH9_ANGAN